VRSSRCCEKCECGASAGLRPRFNRGRRINLSRSDCVRLTSWLKPQPTKILEFLRGSQATTSKDSRGAARAASVRCVRDAGLLVMWLLAVDDAGFHYEGNLLERGDVFQRIAGDGDYVCLIAGLECSDSILPAQEFCAVQRASLN
jgi:hypothetical protein